MIKFIFWALVVWFIATYFILWGVWYCILDEPEIVEIVENTIRSVLVIGTIELVFFAMGALRILVPIINNLL